MLGKRYLERIDNDYQISGRWVKLARLCLEAMCETARFRQVR